MLLVRDLDPIALGAKPGTVVSEEVSCHHRRRPPPAAAADGQPHATRARDP